MMVAAPDWRLAEATAQRLVRPGPEITADGAVEAVESLRAAAGRARDLVAEVTGLEGEPVPVRVVDRPNWLTAAIAGFEDLLAPVAEQQGGFGAALSARVAGIETGALLAYLARRVLGQYDPYRQPSGHLLLVAPNIVQAERDLGADPGDFRLWVALHEQTHVVQFTHGVAPWLRDHLRGRIATLVTVTEIDPELLTSVVRGVAAAARGREGGGLELTDLVRTPEQRALVEEITAVMSLLEGHADLVMDEVGPRVIPSVASIRSRFDHRRSRRGLDRVVRNVLGMDAKLRQYRDGAAFCRAVLAQVGMAGLNRVFTDPGTLPRLAEIADPQQWIDRVHPRT